MVVYSNEPHAELRKNLFNIAPRINVIAAKARKIFDDDAVDFTGFDSLHHFLKLRPLKVCPSIAVIAELSDQFNVWLPDCKTLDDCSLAGNAVALHLIPGKRKVAIFLRESKVLGGFVNRI